MKHWPWQHKFQAVSAQKVLADYGLRPESRLSEGIGTRETIVLLRCDCGKVKTKKLLGHWDADSLKQAFGSQP